MRTMKSWSGHRSLAKSGKDIAEGRGRREMKTTFKLPGEHYDMERSGLFASRGEYIREDEVRQEFDRCIFAPDERRAGALRPYLL